MDFINELNENQREAVVNTEGPTLVIAGAGSGKTRVLTYRIANLLSKGVPAYRILALTFTNKAAREMQKRIATLVGQGNAANLWMGTFHSIFSKILRVEAEHLGYTSNFTIYDSQDSKNLIKSIVKDLKLDDKVYKPNDVLGRISMAKNNLVVAQAYAQSAKITSADQAAKKPMISEIYKYYQARCKQSDVMDFDDLLLQTNILFRDFPEILEKYQKKFDYILVDEYQDTNYSQYLIIKTHAQSGSAQTATGVQLFGQLFRRTHRHQMPLGKDQHLTAHCLHLAEDVAGQDDRVAFPQLPDQSADLDDLCRVKAHGRLVQNDELRRAQQCLRNAHALAVALGQTADEPGQHLFQPGAAGSFAHLFFAVGLLFDAFQLCSKIQIFLHRHFRVKGRLFGQIAHTGLCGIGLLGQRVR